MQLQFRHIFIYLFSLLAISASAQVPDGGGLIINEINQGTSGSIKEFIELLVLGDPDNPCAPVDLTGWIVDDNNGSFEACGTGVGIATGHYRLTSCYNSVPPGSILVIYNAADVYAGLPADDPTDADGDLVYIIPSNNSCLEANYSIPVSSPANCSYGGTYSTPNLTWAAGMSNTGDAVQVRKPDFSFFHGYSFGNVNTIFPAWPSGADAGSSFNKGSGNLALDCGSCWNSASFITTTAGSGTPGAANTVNNGYFISNIQSCLLNYADLSDPDNCALILDLNENEIAGYATAKGNVIEWVDYNYQYQSVELWRSADASNFQIVDVQNTANLENAAGRFSILDAASGMGVQYYFVRWQKEAAHMSVTSNTISIQTNTATIAEVRIIPNPANDHILMQFPTYPIVTEYTLFSAAGLPIISGQTEALNTIRVDISMLPKGIYYVQGITDAGVCVGRFIKM